MRLLIATAISTLLLISGAFAQSNSPSDTPSERAKSETQVLEKARSQTIASPSMTQDLTGNSSIAAAASGKRSPRSLPLRVSRRTLRPRRCARIRKPSCLIS
jgi:hypothetical protein